MMEKYVLHPDATNRAIVDDVELELNGPPVELTDDQVTRLADVGVEVVPDNNSKEFLNG